VGSVCSIKIRGTDGIELRRRFGWILTDRNHDDRRSVELRSLPEGALRLHQKALDPDEIRSGGVSGLKETTPARNVAEATRPGDLVDLAPRQGL
jgi:hypothetical protein